MTPAHRKIGILLVTSRHFSRRRGRLSDSKTLQIIVSIIRSKSIVTNLKIRIVLIPLLHFSWRRGRLSDSKTLQIIVIIIDNNSIVTRLKIRIVLIALLHLSRRRSSRFPCAEALKTTL